MVPIRKRRTDGRAAFENIPDALQPVSFVLEIVGVDGKAIANKSFEVDFDDGSRTTRDTDGNGIIKLAKSFDEFQLSTEFDADNGGEGGEEKFQRYRMETISE
jgi:hypothetical protein